MKVAMDEAIGSSSDCSARDRFKARELQYDKYIEQCDNFEMNNTAISFVHTHCFE